MSHMVQKSQGFRYFKDAKLGGVKMTHKKAKEYCKTLSRWTKRKHKVVKSKEWKLDALMAGGDGYTSEFVYSVVLA